MATSSSQFPFVVLESRDGCGKTTISKALSATIGATLIKSPTQDIVRFREFYDCCGNFDARFLYYLGAVVIASSYIKELLQSGPVVCDRYIDSTVVYHHILGVDTSIVDIAKLGLVVPTLTVCLTCDEDVLAERMRLRGENNPDKLEDVIDLREVDHMLQSRIKTHVDTSHTTPGEAAKLIAAMI